MRRLLRRLVVISSVVGVVMALNVGVAFAHPPNAPFTDDVNDAPVFAPVGSHIAPDDPGRVHGKLKGIDNNPNCPLHYPH